MTVWLIAAFAALILIPLLGRTYFQAMIRHVHAAEPAWDRLVKHAGQLIDDDSVPDVVARYAYGFAMMTGCGCFTTRLLSDVFTGRMDQKATTGGHTALAEGIAKLTVEQRKLFGHVVADALLFDSYQLPIRGTMLRRALWWIYTVSAKRDAYMPPEQLKDVAIATEKVVRKKASEKKVLATVDC